MDTDAVVAAMRSPDGASAALLKLASVGAIQLTATVPLCLEYEAVCSRPAYLLAAGLQPDEAVLFLDVLIRLIDPAIVWFLWRPQLRDPGDELVLEAAINGRADLIATFNQRDFGRAMDRFGLEAVVPSEVLRRLR